MGGSKEPADLGSWLACVYELNAYREAWRGFSVLIDSTVRFASKPEASEALGIAIDGDSFTSVESAPVQRAHELVRPVLINTTPRPGRLALSVLYAPHLDGNGLMTFALSDSVRSISAMTQALAPAADADHARARLLESLTAARADPERDPAEMFLETRFGVAPEDPEPHAREMALSLAGLTDDDLRRSWSTYVGNTCIGAFHSDCWTRRPRRRILPTGFRRRRDMRAVRDRRAA